MKVLVSQRHVTWKYGLTCDVLEHNYIRFLEAHGVNVVPVSNVTTHAGKYMSDDAVPDGVVLTGGNDVSPSEYGENSGRSKDVSRDRDKTEKALMAFAMERKLPVIVLDLYKEGSVVRAVCGEKEGTKIGG